MVVVVPDVTVLAAEDPKLLNHEIVRIIIKTLKYSPQPQ